MSIKKKSSGFTLLELIITVSIATILASIALPNLQTFVMNNRVASASSLFQVSLAYARSESIKRGFNVSVCVANPTQTACDATQDNYARGWLVFTDFDNNGVFNPAVRGDTNGDGVITMADENETILQVSQALNSKLAIHNAGVFEDSITFRPTGQVTAALVNPNDRFYIDTDNKTHRNIVIGVTGRIKPCVVSTPSSMATC